MLLWATFIFIISCDSNPSSHIPEVLRIWLRDTMVFDRPLKYYSGMLFHLFEFGVLAFLLIRALARQKQKYSHLILAFILTVLYALSDEIHQIYTPERAFEAVDLILDSFGAILGLGIYTLLLRRQKHKLAKFAQNLHTDPA